MSERIAEIIAAETIDTLEKLAFIFAETEDDPERFTGADLVTVSAAYTGPYAGRLVMEFAAEALAELAANMLGLDPGEAITEEERHDALKETLNVICGNVLPAIAGSEAVFNISAPQVTRGPFAGDQEAASAVARLTMDEGYLILYLFCDGDLQQ